MAYFEILTSEKQEDINDKLLVKVRAEHEQAYQSNLSRAKSKKQKAKCAGRYEGSWWRLMNQWRENLVTNLHVNDCLMSDIVAGDIDGVKFQSAG